MFHKENVQVDKHLHSFGMLLKHEAGLKYFKYSVTEDN